jgi:biotin carboxylase
MSARKRIILIGSGMAAFREYALSAVASKADVVLVSKFPLTWETPYCVDSVVVDIDDFPAVIERLTGLNPDGVLTYDERYVELTAQLTAMFGVAGPTVDAVRAVKDKSELRGLLRQAGVGAIGFGVAETVRQAHDIVDVLGLPVVFKPRALGGSVGVRLVTSADQIEGAFADAVGARIGPVRSRYDGVLIEEYIDGPEISVDAVTYQGVTTPLVIAEKETGLDPYFEELGHIVPPRAELLSEEALDLVRRTHQVAGLDNVVSHTELRLSSRGPRVIELNARLAGDLIPYLGLLAHGVDLAGAAADIALGIEPSTERKDLGTAAVRFLYPAQDILVRSVSLPKPVEEYPGLDSFTVLCEPGTEVLLPPRGYLSRLASLVAHGDTREECLATISDCSDAVAIDTEVLSTDTTQTPDAG